MLYTVIKDSYQDSINLMLFATNEVNDVEGVNKGARSHDGNRCR